MKRLILECQDVKIDFYTNSVEIYDKFLHDKRELADDIPGIIVKPDNNSKSNDASLTYLDQEKEYIDINEKLNQATIHFPRAKLMSASLNFLLLSMFAKELNKSNKYILHASAIEKDGKSILLIGDSGSGKTTLALYLCMEKGYKLLSNDRTVIGEQNGKAYIFDGTLTTDIRLGMIPEFFPILSDKVDPAKMLDPWNNKMFLNPEFDNLGIGIGNSAAISKVIFVSTYPVGKEFTVFSKMPDDAAILLTFNAASEYIRVPRGIVLNAGYPFPSFDDLELAQKRVDFINKLMQENKGAYNARGNIKKLAELIDQASDIR